MGGTAADRITNTGDGHPSLNGKTLGAAGGSDRNTLTIPQLPAHGHPYRTSSDTGDIDGGNAGLVKSDSGTTQAAHSGPVSASAGELIGGSGEGKPHPNLQPTIIINKIIFTGVYPAP
jgi:microcystin-dependent protein